MNEGEREGEGEAGGGKGRGKKKQETNALSRRIIRRGCGALFSFIYLFIYSFFFPLAAINSQFAKFVNSNIRIYSCRCDVECHRTYAPRNEYMKYPQFSQIKRRERRIELDVEHRAEISFSFSLNGISNDSTTGNWNDYREPIIEPN